MAVDETTVATEFEPKVVAFMCNWCTYAGADNAGVARIQSPANILPIRVMCSGRISPEIVLRTFREGADGVLVSGCHPGDCHYVNGNLKARRRIKLLKEILPRFGFDERRVKLTWIGASEGVDFAKTIKEMVSEIKALGPNEVKQQMVL